MASTSFSFLAGEFPEEGSFAEKAPQSFLSKGIRRGFDGHVVCALHQAGKKEKATMDQLKCAFEGLVDEIPHQRAMHSPLFRDG